jgi:hypothetical protein
LGALRRAQKAACPTARWHHVPIGEDAHDRPMNDERNDYAGGSDGPKTFVVWNRYNSSAPR